MLTTTEIQSLISPPAAASPAELPPSPTRVLSIDAFRGFVMLLMASAGLAIPRLLKVFESTPAANNSGISLDTWRRLAFHTSHVEWTGCSLWDLIQPSFIFLVGTAMAFSLANRLARGHSFSRMFLHALWRALVLVLLGVFLASLWRKTTLWTFTNTLTQIGLAYAFLFLVAWLRPRWQFAIAMLILLGYWAAFALYPVPAANFDLKAYNLPADWSRRTGFEAHWEKNTNLAARADQWLLNRFPQGKKPYEFNDGGYQTLNFIPSIATMIFGLLAGEWIRQRRSPTVTFALLLGAGILGVAAGWTIAHYGCCPIVKRIWTPSWTLYSAGLAFLFLAFFYLIIDVIRLKFWAYPLIVVGANSIAIYCMTFLFRSWFHENMRRHFGDDVYAFFGKTWVPMTEATCFLLFCWFLCWWMHRRKIFLKI